MSGEAIAKDRRPGSLGHLAGEFRVIAKRASAAVEHVGTERVADRPSPARWSVAENLIHLTLASEAYLPIWQESLQRARDEVETSHENIEQAPFKLDGWGKFWVWFLEPPPKARFRSPKRFRPVVLPPAEEVLATFLESQDGVLSAIELGEGLALDQMKIHSAFGRGIRYSVWSSFCATLAHQRRHLWQAETAADQVLKSKRT